MAATANATVTRIGTHLGRLEIMLTFMGRMTTLSFSLCGTGTAYVGLGLIDLVLIGAK